MTTYLEFACERGAILDSTESAKEVNASHRASCENCQDLEVLAEHRDEMHRDMAVCWDLNARWLNTEAEPNYPVEGCGDALARLRREAS